MARDTPPQERNTTGPLPREVNTKLFLPPPCFAVNSTRVWPPPWSGGQLYVYFANSSAKVPTLVGFAQLHAFWLNSTRFGPTPRVLAQLHTFFLRPTPRVFPLQLDATANTSHQAHKGRNARVAHASHARASRAAARLRAKRGKEARETTHRATERSPETHPGARTANCDKGKRTARGLAARRARRASRATKIVVRLWT